MISSDISISGETIETFLKTVLLNAGVRDDVAHSVAEGLVQTSLRGVDSHGIRLFPHYIEGAKQGRINPSPIYKFEKTSPSTGKLDADHTFGHAAGIEASKEAVKLAQEAGSAHIAIYNSSHFGAAAYFAFEIAKHDMIGMSFTNTDALIKTYAGKRAFFGNNPICVVVPMEGEDPLCLDMATSVITFNKVRQLNERNIPAPPSTGADADGMETTDASKIKMLLPVGGYKGFGLSMIVEILCSLLSGMPYGPHIPKMFEAPMSDKRYLGHYVTALRIDCFQEISTFKRNLSLMVNEIRNEPRLDEAVGIQVPGDPEKEMFKMRSENGIPLQDELFQQFVKIGKEFNVELQI